MIKQYKLDPEEQAILDEMDRGEWVEVANQKQELAKLQASAKRHGNKMHRVNIRLTDWDYEKVRVQALEQGVPFTTLIGSIVHQFLSGKLLVQ
jgi:predicted DNA binding CopG/RHH family protein